DRGAVIAERREDQVLAVDKVLDDVVAGALAEIEHVLSGTAEQDVVALAALEVILAVHAHQDIVALVAGEHVVARIAGGVDVLLAQQGKILEIVAQREGGAGFDGIVAEAGLFDDIGARLADDVGVVAVAAIHLAFDLAFLGVEDVVA